MLPTSGPESLEIRFKQATLKWRLRRTRGRSALRPYTASHLPSFAAQMIVIVTNRASIAAGCISASCSFFRILWFLNDSV